MENNKKVKFNGMDLFICIMAVLICAAAVYMLYGRGHGGVGTAAKNTNVTVTVELTAQEENMTDVIKVGDSVAIGEKDKAKATVSKVEVLPARTIGYDINEGRVLNSEVPNQYDIKVSMTAEGTETESAVSIDGIAMRVGQSTVLSAKGWAGHGYTIGLSTED